LSSKPELSLLDKLPYVKDAGYESGNRETCLEGTREAELQRIEDWEAHRKEKLVCWLTGTAGSGKTTIAQTFAKRSADNGRLGASFFCSSIYVDRRNINRIFPTLAFQLALRHPEYKDALIPIIKSNPNVGHESLDNQLEILIVQPLKLTKVSTTIVIDALDECEAEHEDDKQASRILSLLARRIKQIQSVKFLITGRPEPPIRSVFRREPLHPHTEVFPLHEIKRESVDQDIERYLRIRLSEIGKQRSDLDLDVPWPADEDITAATKICSGLFIVASVIVKIIAASPDNPREQLKAIISRLDSPVFKGRSGVDKIYYQVFLSYGDMDDIQFFVRLRLVVGSIVLAFNPLSRADLATILNIPSERVRTALHLLHSVFVVPDSKSEPIEICHKSLADYVTDPDRCNDKRFTIEPTVYHLELGTRCLELMKAALKKNICGLPRFSVNADIDDLHARREKHIVPGLQYACKSWAKHLRHASREGDNVSHVVQLLNDFFRHRLLQWLEVLSIVGDLLCAVHSLHDVTAWLIDVSAIRSLSISLITECKYRLRCMMQIC
jgi:NACHT domain